MINKIAILHFAAPPIVGGVESTIFHHARLLAEAGYEAHVIAGRGEPFHPDVQFHHIPEIDSRHPDVLQIGDALAKGTLTPDFEALRDHLTKSLGAILQDIPICIVHNVITLHKNIPLTAALSQLNQRKTTRLIAWCHDFAWMDELYTSALHNGYPWDLLRTPWPNVDYVTVSEDRRTKLAALLKIPEYSIDVVTPGIDLYEFLKLEPLTRQLVERLKLTNAAPLMLLPARITRRKNIEFALRVTAVLKDTTPQPTLLITGPPGPHNPKNIAYLQSLKTLRSDLGLEEQVHFAYELGESDEPLHLTDKVIADLYSLADLLLFPSLREGFGIPVLEAGLARMPVFAADIPPVRESSGEFATLFDSKGDPASVAELIRAHLENESAYLLRQRVLKYFTWRRILEKDIIPLIQKEN
ncbi:MAG: glycosyltransferase family 4 protein [Anaerolineales bacterium]|nr:glycosyltransferase family 4 protein [Anaerolineales bacterium]